VILPHSAVEVHIQLLFHYESDLGLGHQRWNCKCEGQKNKYVGTDTRPPSGPETYGVQHHRQSLLANHNKNYTLLLEPMNP